MTRLSDFLAGRGPAEMYDTYWVPCLLEPFARDMAALASRGNHVLGRRLRHWAGHSLRS
jgi:hypothetical protein